LSQSDAFVELFSWCLFDAQTLQSALFLSPGKELKHDTCVQGHYLELVVSLIKIYGRFHTLRYVGNRVS
jgi:hypothetical protein